MRLLPLLAAALIAAPGASAVTLTEAPPLVLRGDRYCVDVTDTPGEVVVPTRDGVRFVQATRTGLQPGSGSPSARGSAASRSRRARRARA